MKRRILASALLAGAVALGGCATGDGEGNSEAGRPEAAKTTTTTPTQFGNACSALSPDQVQVLLGTTAGGNPPTNDNGKNQSTCTWTAGTKILIVQLGNGQAYASAKAQYPEATPVPGIGKEAFEEVTPQGINGGALSQNGLQSVLMTYPGGTQADLPTFTKLLQQAADTLARAGGPQFNENPPPMTNANGQPTGPGN